MEISRQSVDLLTPSVSDVQLPVPDCELIIKAAGEKFDCSRIQSAYKVLQHEVRENRFQKIGSSCPALDLLLTGGIRIGDLTELYGEAGSGKTQLCHQLCINVQMPKSQDGHEAEAVFMDCENGFRSERLLQMAAASAEQWFDPPVDASLMLRKVHHMRCTSADILRNAVMYELEQFLSDHPQVSISDAVTGRHLMIVFLGTTASAGRDAVCDEVRV